MIEFDGELSADTLVEFLLDVSGVLSTSVHICRVLLTRSTTRLITRRRAKCWGHGRCHVVPDRAALNTSEVLPIDTPSRGRLSYVSLASTVQTLSCVLGDRKSVV